MKKCLRAIAKAFPQVDLQYSCLIVTKKNVNGCFVYLPPGRRSAARSPQAEPSLAYCQL